MGTERTNEIDDAASDWLIRRDSGAWNDADQARFNQWLNASTLNRVAFLRLELAWEDAARLKALGAGIPGDRPPPPGRWNVTPFFDLHPASVPDENPPSLTAPDSGRLILEESSAHESPGGVPARDETSAQRATRTLQATAVSHGESADDSDSLHRSASPSTFPTPPPSAVAAKPVGFNRRRITLAAAATLLLAVGIAAYVALAPGGERYSTSVGGFASVPMADGSKVTLNTDSQIRIALTETERRVELKHGEAFFEVSKDPSRPFIVRVGSKRVIAVGTQFSVRREGDDVEVVVTEGKVRVEDGAAGRISRAYQSADVYLTPGSIARVGDDGVLVQRKTLPEAEEQLSWRTGVLTFRDQSLAEVIAEFNRYNVRKIVIQDPAVASLKIEGNFRATNVEAFVRLLESGFPVRAEARADQIVLMLK
jgi:transmembrane sensor